VSNTLRLSVLDQSPVPAGFTPTDALNNSLSLAQHADALGYHRLWYSEHHAMALLACSAPDILIARAAAATSRIRLGSGGIMLPHYSAYKVAEVFRTLHAMFPGRIDLGIGRAPGGGQLEAHALRRYRQAPPPDDFPQQLAELRAFLDPTRWAAFTPANGSSSPHPYSQILTAPDSPGAPDIWLLGSSMWSAVTAAQEGLPYAFAHFFSPIQTRQAITYYQQNFIPSIARSSSGLQPAENPAQQDSGFSPGRATSTPQEESSRPESALFADGVERPASPEPATTLYRTTPEATLCIGVICAETDAEADRLHASVRLLQRRIRTNDRRPVATPEDALLELNERPTAPNPNLPFFAGSLDAPEEGEYPRYLVGTPDRVAQQLRNLATDLNLNELIINTITHSHEARLRSYTLLAEAMDISSPIHSDSPAGSLA
jgi:luciferase family oxidoreductase group 1